MKLYKCFGMLFVFFYRLKRRLSMWILMPLFKRHGDNFVFDPNGVYTFGTISVGNDVYLGPGAILISSESTITIGNKVFFGPNVTLIGGDHNTAVLGKYMFDVREKKEGDDLPIVIEDDVWVGTGATVLKGVRIGTGSIIAAGSLVRKDVPPYAIVGGVPARILKYRWGPEDLKKHKEMLSLCGIKGENMNIKVEK